MRRCAHCKEFVWNWAVEFIFGNLFVTTDLWLTAPNLRVKEM